MTQGDLARALPVGAVSQQVFDRSGAAYAVDAVKGADHRLDPIDGVIRQTENLTIAQKASRFFGLAGPPR